MSVDREGKGHIFTEQILFPSSFMWAEREICMEGVSTVFCCCANTQEVSVQGRKSQQKDVIDMSCPPNGGEGEGGGGDGGSQGRVRIGETEMREARQQGKL